MPVKVAIQHDTYYGSVSLIYLSTKTNRIEGIQQVVVAMA